MNITGECYLYVGEVYTDMFVCVLSECGCLCVYVCSHEFHMFLCLYFYGEEQRHVKACECNTPGKGVLR